MSPIHAWACFNRRTITRTASHSRLLSLGSCISAAVTVLSRRTTLPSSIFSCRALVSSIRLIASQVSARIALIVLCSTDFFGLHAHGRAGKGPERGGVLEMEGQFLVAQLAVLLEKRTAQHRLSGQTVSSGLLHPVAA